jgi:hypothetical protein
VTSPPQSGLPQDNSSGSSAAPDAAVTDAGAAVAAAIAAAASAAYAIIPTSSAPEAAAAAVTVQPADATPQALPLLSPDVLSQDDSSRADYSYTDPAVDTFVNSTSSSHKGRQHVAAPFPMSPTHSSSLFPTPKLNPVTYTPSSPPATTPHPYNMQLRRRSSGGLADAAVEPLSPSSSSGPYSPR